MLCQIRAGVGTMVLDSKQMELTMEESLVSVDTHRSTNTHTRTRTHTHTVQPLSRSSATLLRVLTREHANVDNTRQCHDSRRQTEYDEERESTSKVSLYRQCQVCMSFNFVHVFKSMHVCVSTCWHTS